MKQQNQQQQHEELTHFAGFDWARDHHDVIILDPKGRMVSGFRFDHTAAGWNLWLEKTAAFPKLGVAVETSYGAAVDQLLQSGATVYPVNPVSAKRFRERKHPSGNKTDRHDAWALADALRTDGHAWQSLGEQDPVIAELRILCRDEVALIGERTALINQLQQALHEYYPTALEAFDDWTSPHAWAFVEAFPDASALAKAGKRKWDKFLHSRNLFRPQTYGDRIAAFEKAGQWRIPAPVLAAKRLYALSKCRQLKVIQEQLDEYRGRIEKLFESHPDSQLFGSLPGAGPKLAPRLLGEIGSDRTLYEDANGLQRVAGTAPVSFQTGKIHKVTFRRACNPHLRHAMHLFADKSRAQCVWAKTYYDAVRKRGKSHAQALRCLGQRWLKIIWKMWQTGTSYNGELHMGNQLAHGSWVLQVNPQ